MTIPVGYAQISHFLGGDALPTGGAVTYGVDLDGTLDTPAQVAESCHLDFASAIMPVISLNCEMTGTLCKFGPDATGASGEFSQVDAGSVVDSADAPNVALLCQKQTALGGREGRGRFYMPGVGESSVQVGGDLTGDLVTTWPAACTSLKGKLDLSGFCLLYTSPSPRDRS